VVDFMCHLPLQNFRTNLVIITQVSECEESVCVEQDSQVLVCSVRV